MSLFQFLHHLTFTSYISRIWNSSPTSSWPGCGVLRWWISMSPSIPITPPASGWCPTAVQPGTTGSDSQESTRCHKSTMVIGPNLLGSQLQTTGWLTPTPVQLRASLSLLWRSSEMKREPNPHSAIYHLKCLIFNHLYLEFLERVTSKMQFIQKHAWSPNTVKAICSEWKAFKQFCLLANIVYLPVAPYVICFFAVWLISTGRVKTRNSLAQYVSAVRTVHVALDFPEIPTPSQSVSYTHLTLPTIYSV